jgi:glycosyltransferase involved in cell wall biosynthesis
MKSGSKIVSVIVPTFNGAAYLSDALSSIRNQTYPKIQLIVVDDGSTDHSVEIARSYGALVIIQKRQGPGAARNTGIRNSLGAHIAFLDQDDVWHLDKIEQQLEIITTGDYVACKAIASLEESAPFASLIARNYMSTSITTAPSALLIPRALFETVGFFDERYHYNSEVAWHLKANSLGLRMVSPDPVLLTKRFHEKNQGRDIKSAQNEMLQIIRDARKMSKT